MFSIQTALPTTSAVPRFDWRHLGSWALLLVIVIGCALCVWAPLDRDEGAFLVIAQEVLHGRLPYRDVFDQKSPGIYYLLAGLLALTKPLNIMAQILTMRLCVVAINILSGIGLLQLGKRLWGAETGRLAAVFWLAACAVPLFGANRLITEPFATVAVIWAAVRLTGKTGFRSALDVGLLLAIGTLFKQTSILALPSFAFLLTMRSAKGGVLQGRQAVASISALLAGVCLPWLFICSLYAAQGALRPLFYQVVIINLVGYPAGIEISARLLFLAGALMLLYAGPILLLLGKASMWAASPQQRRICLDPTIVALALLIILQTAPLVGHPYPHYLIQVFPWLALLLAASLGKRSHGIVGQQSAKAADSFPVRLERAARPILIALPLTIASLLALVSVGVNARGLSEQIATGAWIAAETSPNARLLVAPAEPEYYYLSGRLPVTAYVYLLPVNHAVFPLTQVTDDIRSQHFDVVVWSMLSNPDDSRQQYTALFQSLQRDYQAVPGSNQSVILFKRR